MMDLKEIIKWFILCFHIFPVKKRKMDSLLTAVCLFFYFNSCAGMAAKLNGDVGVSEDDIVGSTKNVGLNLNNYDETSFLNQSESTESVHLENLKSKSVENTSVGRTFGGPFMKKVIGGLLPLVFQVGMASTWAVVAALVGIKTLVVTLIILKLLLVAGAAKIGAFFANKGHHEHHHGWEQPPVLQKEIHLHIHNGQLGHNDHHEEHVPLSPWNREGLATDTKNLNIIIDPYRAGPQTISTPFGNYVKIQAANINPQLLDVNAS